MWDAQVAMATMVNTCRHTQKMFSMVKADRMCSRQYTLANVDVQCGERVPDLLPQTTVNASAAKVSGVALGVDGYGMFRQHGASLIAR